MFNLGQQIADSLMLSSKINRVWLKRAQHAQKNLEQSLQQVAQPVAEAAPDFSPWAWWLDAGSYALDSAQRSLLLWDTLRQRGNEFNERTRAGLPPVLHFDYEILLDARTFERPVNYALVRIVPPEGVTVDNKRRPYIIIDPRAGHGPGIGGFKDDSQVGVALREGHPVYFVIFFPEPEPGQTMTDVCAAEQQFVRHVRKLHPKSAKPALVGNCQGGWAAMMLAASTAEDTGPIVINGAPMSYWGGAWTEGEGNNPMRYAGGMLGGTWMASLFSDLGGGKFDGAWLVQNFESLHPSNTHWSKLYNVYRNVDTEAPRFLEFERWWGGYYLMNRQEIEWITHNLFVGNKLWAGDVKSASGEDFDLRDIRSPIVLFASMGDNITPPQQAFNWVADIYSSTDEIKSRGQVIVGLLHADVGHLGIFVSGRIAKREHKQIVSVLKTIESLPPGLYGMHINEERDADGSVVYSVDFEERQLEDVVQRLNKFDREDEAPFKAVAMLSDFNQRAYELFVRPQVQALVTDASAQASRDFHPLRVDKWWYSDLNPLNFWMAPAAELARANRQVAPETNRWRQVENGVGDLIVASLDFYRDLRDASSEAQFFEIYGNLCRPYLADDTLTPVALTQPQDPRELPLVQAALARMTEGGYAAALARTAELMESQGIKLPLAMFELKAELMGEYGDLIPKLPVHEWKLVRGEQDVIVRYEPERALATLPKLLEKGDDRKKYLQWLERLQSDPRLLKAWASHGRGNTVTQIRQLLAASAPAAPVPPSLVKVG
jgi:pimeloyl-ACP methyl ester carboxylesterase